MEQLSQDVKDRVASLSLQNEVDYSTLSSSDE